MKDRFFYLVAVIVIAVIIGLALLPGKRVNPVTSEDVLAQGYTLSGDGFLRLTTAPGTLVNFTTNSNGEIIHTEMFTNIPKKMATPSAGVFGLLGPIYEETFSGKPLKITITARAGDEKPLAEFQTAYFSGTASSGWQTFALNPEYKDYIFNYTPPKKNKILGQEYIGIWPGQEGRSLTMYVKMIKVEVATPQ